jgi:hypothetical protein
MVEEVKIDATFLINEDQYESVQQITAMSSRVFAI